MIKNALLTGGTGLTGNALLRYLLDKGVNVTVLVRSNSSRLSNLPDNPNMRVVFCNIDGYSSIDEKINDVKYDAFFHLAWDGSLGNQKVNNRYNVPLQLGNLNSFIQAVELCNRLGCKKFIATGSQAEYGVVNHKIDEDTEKLPSTAYGSAKVCSSNLAKILCEQYGIVFVWVRLFSVFGPFDGAMSLVDTAIRELIENEKSISYTSGEQKWNYLYSYDAAKAMYLLAEKCEESDVFCVASAHGRRLKDYISAIHSIANPSVAPALGEKESTSLVELDVDISKLIDKTGFTEDYSFEEGIKIIVDKFKETL